jgi:hypothetical protein
MEQPLTSLPARPLDAATVRALNQSDKPLMALPISYYKEDHIYSLLLVTDTAACVGGYDGDTWRLLARTGRDPDEGFDPEAVVDAWAKETHPEKYGDPAFEVTSEEYAPD